MRPETYANTASVTNPIAARPAASPSMPSVRLAALLTPTRMKVVNTTYSGSSAATAGSTNTYLKNGSVVDAPGRLGEIGNFQRYHPRNTPIVTWPVSL